MMYVIYNNDGSIKGKFLNEFVMQGNNNVNELFVAIEGREDYSLYASFKMPNGSTTTVVSSTPATEFIEGLGTFTGRKILLSNAETLVAGALQMNVVCLDENDNKIVAFSTYITVNETGIQLSDPVLLTVQEYENLISEIKAKISYPTKYVQVTTLPDDPDLDTVYVLKGEDDLNEVFMFNGKTESWIPLGSNRINLGNYYTKEEGEEFEEGIEERVSSVENELSSVASGSPKGIYSTLADLEATYPTGTEGIFVVQDDGHWYYWSGSAWTDGGVYTASPSDTCFDKNSKNSVQNQFLTLVQETNEEKNEGWINSIRPKVVKVLKDHDLRNNGINEHIGYFVIFYECTLGDTLAINFLFDASTPVSFNNAGDTLLNNPRIYFYDTNYTHKGDSDEIWQYSNGRSILIPFVQSRTPNPLASFSVGDKFLVALCFPNGSNTNAQEYKKSALSFANNEKMFLKVPKDLFKKTDNLFDKEKLYKGRPTTNYGIPQTALTNSGYLCTPLIEIDNTKNVYCSFNGYGTGDSGNLTANQYAQIFDESLNNIGVNVVIQKNLQNGVRGIDIINDYPTAKYILFSWISANLDINKMYITQIPYSNDSLVGTTQQGTKKPVEIDEKYLPSNIVARNKDIENILNACSNYRVLARNGSNTRFKKAFTILITTDVHADRRRFANAIEYLNAMPQIDAGACLGDIAGNNYAESDGTWYSNLVLQSNKDFYTILGNHDSGNGTNASTNSTVAQAFTKWVEPTKSKIGIGDLSVPYYVKHFNDDKLSLIFLNIYDVPDTMEGTNFAVSRGLPNLQQTQVNWLISTLQNIPSGNHVAIFLHFMPETLTYTGDKWCAYGRNSGILNSSWQYGSMLSDIVNAWVNGTSLVQNYAPTNNSYLQTITVNADFTSRGSGIFVGYIAGHSHTDFTATVNAHNTQYVYSMYCTANDNSQAENICDLPRPYGTKCEDSITAISIDTNNNMIKFTRIGSNISVEMKDRTYYLHKYQN